MKRTILIFLLAIIAIPAFTFAQVDCPQTDCPGRCGRFIDENGDGFCDHGHLSSQAEVKATEATSTAEDAKAASETKNTAQKPQTKKQADQPAASPSEKSEPDGVTGATAPAPENAEPNLSAPEMNEVESNMDESSSGSPYHLILISLLTIGLYAFTFILVKAKVMKLATHRKIWNVLLLISALVSCLLGFFLVIQINYDIKMDWFWTVKLLHVEFGIAMTIIALFHILWHTNYWKSLLRNKKKEEQI
ncbi:MAG: hypothetical protein J6T13_08480 [Bacteroidales bacterium]|nr:hypothetical protein [Bacteroidales bacterium]